MQTICQKGGRVGRGRDDGSDGEMGKEREKKRKMEMVRDVVHPWQCMLELWTKGVWIECNLHSSIVARSFA